MFERNNGRRPKPEDRRGDGDGAARWKFADLGKAERCWLAGGTVWLAARARRHRCWCAGSVDGSDGVLTNACVVVNRVHAA